MHSKSLGHSERQPMYRSGMPRGHGASFTMELPQQKGDSWSVTLMSHKEKDSRY